jgi:hypothetical protein
MPTRILCLLLVTLTACATTAAREEPPEARFVSGQTTVAQVVQALGQPTTWVVEADGARTLVYVATVWPVQAYTPFGFLAGGPASPTQQVRIFAFGPDGVLR